MKQIIRTKQTVKYLSYLELNTFSYTFYNISSKVSGANVMYSYIIYRQNKVVTSKCLERLRVSRLCNIRSALKHLYYTVAPSRIIKPL